MRDEPPLPYAADGNGEFGDIVVRWSAPREVIDREAGTSGVVANPALEIIPFRGEAVLHRCHHRSFLSCDSEQILPVQEG
jgi:hypothetical protein